MNRHALMICLCLFVIIPLAFTLPVTWAIVMQSAIAGASVGAHGVMWMKERKKA